MEFGLSEEQVMLQDNVDRYLKDHCDLDFVRGYAGGKNNDRAVWQGFTELGIASLVVPEADGGVGLGYLDAALVAERMGYHVMPAPYLSSAVIAPTMLVEIGGRHTDKLSALMNAQLRCGLAFSEAAAGARQGYGVTADGERLSGTTRYVLDFAADAYLVSDHQGHLYWLDAQQSGVTTEPLSTIDATRCTGQLTLANAQAEAMSDDPRLLNRLIDIARVMLAADTLGAAQAMLDQSVAYAMQREQFNRVIASFQAVKHMCAEMAANLEPCRAMVWYAAHSLDEQAEDATMMACHTKAHLAEVGQFVARTATEVHGGMGFTDLLGLHYWFKRIGFNRQMLGSPEHLRVAAAQAQAIIS